MDKYCMKCGTYPFISLLHHQPAVLGSDEEKLSSKRPSFAGKTVLERTSQTGCCYKTTKKC